MWTFVYVHSLAWFQHYYMLIIYLVLGTKFNRFNTISKIHPNAFWQHVEVSSMSVFPILTANSTFQSETSFTIENITSEEIKFKVRFSNDTNFSSKPIIGNIPAKSKETVKGEAFWIIMKPLSNNYIVNILYVFSCFTTKKKKLRLAEFKITASFNLTQKI